MKDSDQRLHVFSSVLTMAIDVSLNLADNEVRDGSLSKVHCKSVSNSLKECLQIVRTIFLEEGQVGLVELRNLGGIVVSLQGHLDLSTSCRGTGPVLLLDIVREKREEGLGELVSLEIDSMD